MTDDATNQNDEVKESASAEATADKEEVKAEEAKVEAPKEEPKAEAPKAEGKPAAAKASDAKLSAKLEKIAKEIEGLTALELSELAGHLETVFGVSAMPMMAAGGPPAAGGAGADAVEEKTNYDVVLTDGGANKLAVIKAVREIKPDLGLMDAKKMVESAPQTLLSGAKKDDAEAAKKKVEDAGGKVELK